jgi:hypothetical protein
MAWSSVKHKDNFNFNPFFYKTETLYILSPVFTVYTCCWKSNTNLRKKSSLKLRVLCYCIIYQIGSTDCIRRHVDRWTMVVKYYGSEEFLEHFLHHLNKLGRLSVQLLATVPGRERICLLPWPDLLWDPPSYLFNGYAGKSNWSTKLTPTFSYCWG